MRRIVSIIRLPNLLIIVLTYLVLRYGVYLPIYKTTPFLSNYHFIALIFITVTTALAGYIANDYFDLETDNINKPQKVYIGKSISPGTAFSIAVLFTFVALAVCVRLSILLGSFWVALFILTAIFLTWAYAIWFKRSFFIGNLVVAMLSAGAVFLLLIAEQQSAKNIENELFTHAFPLIARISIGVGIFAFLLSLMREIVKDAEDVQGDRKINCRTLPIVLGIAKTKRIVFILSLITLALLVISQVLLVRYSKWPAIIWVLAGVEIPVILFLIKLPKAHTPANFHLLSSLLKWVMIAGILTLAAGQF